MNRFVYHFKLFICDIILKLIYLRHKKQFNWLISGEKGDILSHNKENQLLPIIVTKL